MTKELRNAVSRLRKLQDAAFAGKIEYPSVQVGLSFHTCHYQSGNRATIDVSVCIHNEYQIMEKHLYYSLSDVRCYEIGGDIDNNLQIEDILHSISEAVGYPV